MMKNNSSNVSFDIDVGLIKVWVEKKDIRRREVNEFFNLLDKYKEKFLLIMSKHTVEHIDKWENKILVIRLKDLFTKYYDQTIDPEPKIKEFIIKVKMPIEDLVKKFSAYAQIKQEDALTMIAYSLIGTEYFVTLNRKHLRNKYEEIKTVGWKFGLKIPEIMLPNEFITFFSKQFSS